MTPRHATLLAATILTSIAAHAISPLSPDQCRGSAMPYVAPAKVVEHPDSLTPVMINHVGRHGARYLSSPSQVGKVLTFLDDAAASAQLTPLGQGLRHLCYRVSNISEGNWGALDSIGIDEQQGIAHRLCQAYPQLVRAAHIRAISSFVPRCIMSMDCFTHRIARSDNSVTITTSSGRINSPLMRPFDLDTTYIAYLHSHPYSQAYKTFYDSIVPTAPAKRLINTTMSPDRLRDGSFALFRMLTGLKASGITVNLDTYFTIDELNALWTIHNLDQYLVRTATTFSTIPADIAAPLLRDIIATTDSFIDGNIDTPIILRFGHAETLMPLLSLMHLPGCYYTSPDLATVSAHWRNFHVVPMASNLQLKLFRAPSGLYYVRADLNETPVPLIASRPDIYIPWNQARDYLLSMLPSHRRTGSS